MRPKYLLSLVLLCYSCAQSKLGSDNETNGWELVWSDDFEDLERVDNSKWTAAIGDGCPELCGYGNKELQSYTNNKKNLRVENGVLIIEAHYDSTKEIDYTSAKVVSKNKGDWRYGKIEIRAKLPDSDDKGTWTAFWMLPTSKEQTIWPDDGEIDIMENVGYAGGKVYGAIHTTNYNGMLGTHIVDSVDVPDLSEAYHDYSIQWDHEIVEWFVDGIKYNEYIKKDHPDGEWPFDQPFHIILNLAVGGNWGGKYGVDNSIWPQKVEVDYVRVYQKPQHLRSTFEPIKP